MARYVDIVMRENNPADDPAVFESRLAALNFAISKMTGGDEGDFEEEEEAEERYDQLVQGDDPWLVVAADMF